MLEIFGFWQVIIICLVSMLALPLVFYLASNQGPKKPGHQAAFARGGKKQRKAAAAKEGGGAPLTQAKKAKGRAASRAVNEQEGTGKTGQREELPEQAEEESQEEDRAGISEVKTRHED